MFSWWVSVMLILDFHLFTLPQTHKEGICPLFGPWTNAVLLTSNRCCNVCWEKNNKGEEKLDPTSFLSSLENHSSQCWNKTFHHLPTSVCPDNIYNVLLCRGRLPKCPPVAEECCVEKPQVTKHNLFQTDWFSWISASIVMMWEAFEANHQSCSQKTLWKVPVHPQWGDGRCSVQINSWSKAGGVRSLMPRVV